MNATTCGCGHLISDHTPGGPCGQWWRYPDVLDARQCGCVGVWQKAPPELTRRLGGANVRKV